jgi:hypothetical protein
MKMLRTLPVLAIAAIAGVLVSFSAPNSAQAQVYPTLVVPLTTACTSDPCAATAVASIAVPGQAATCTLNLYGTYHATAVFEATNVSNNAVLAQWQSVALSPANGGIAGNGIGTSTSRSLSFYGSVALRATQAVRVRLSAYTSGTVNVAWTCAGLPENIQAVPGVSPSASPTP